MYFLPPATSLRNSLVTAEPGDHQGLAFQDQVNCQVGKAQPKSTSNGEGMPPPQSSPSLARRGLRPVAFINIADDIGRHLLYRHCRMRPCGAHRGRRPSVQCLQMRWPDLPVRFSCIPSCARSSSSSSMGLQGTCSAGRSVQCGGEEPSQPASQLMTSRSCALSWPTLLLIAVNAGCRRERLCHSRVCSQ